MMAASLAYYSALSMAPLLVMTLGLVGLLGNGAQERFLDEIGRLVGGQAEAAIRAIVESTRSADRDEGRFATVVGTVVLLVSGTAVFAQLQSAMNVVWRVEPHPERAWLSWLRVRAISLAVVAGSAFLLLVSLAITTVLSWTFVGVDGFVWQIVNFGIALLAVAAVFALIFKLLPDVDMSWRDTAFGAVLTSMLFGVGKFAIGEYLGRASVGSAYGAAGSFVVLLTWTFYSSLILLIGAEITQMRSARRGHRATAMAHAEPQPAPTGEAGSEPPRTLPNHDS